MIVTFCGHSNCSLTEDEKQILNETLISIITNNTKCVFYLGGYGNFDAHCLKVLNIFKKTYNNIEVVFVTPYLYSNYNKLKFANEYYDYTLYPPLENTPLKFAIIKRNEWLVLNSDYLICYINKNYGGAFTMFNYAKKRNLPFINISKQ